MNTEETSVPPATPEGPDSLTREHPHNHPHEHTRTVLHRLSRAIGHLESVRRMVEEGRDCTDVLLQLAAVRGALNAVSRIVLRDHMEHCIVDAVERGDGAALEELRRAIDQMIT